MGGLLRLADGGKQSQIPGGHVGRSLLPANSFQEQDLNPSSRFSSAVYAERCLSFSSLAPLPPPSHKTLESTPATLPTPPHPTGPASPTYIGRASCRDR